MSLLAGLRERRERGELAVDLEASRARIASLESVASTLLGCVRALVLDLEDLGATEVKAGLSTLAAEIRGGDDDALTAAVARQQREVLAFADREREYLDHRDAELRRIIQVLSDGLAGVSAGAAAYHRRLLDNGSRLEVASRLSDLQRMRAAITAEVAGLRTAIAERQAEESTATRALRSEIEQLRLNVARAQTEARTDPLTGAANRGAFDEELARRCALATAGRDHFTLLLADIDFFKKINDTYGHPVGDRVLTAFVGFLRARVRESDMVARCGGEEFAVILPGASVRPALRKARKMIEELAQSDWEVDPTTKLRFTASMGVAEWQSGDGPESLIERVDKALYRSKHEGRNRVSKAA
ncbi:MAG TPA: GGDEF domain-containing protein [Kofleriaceae bacterium]|nr:GGDEF domain-containing protein [Kofleriaceae bacterium]